ncbi:MAG TPA: DoxX family protein [Hyphomonadaceae bacterium]|nr:DoxX family protein [Hyphomonadaceae bacterium]
MTDTSKSRGKMFWIGWAVSGFVALFLAFSASLKFLMPDIVRETMSGLDWPAHHDLFIGIIETVCVMIYIIPQTAVLGAILETALLGGAIATNVRVDNPLFSHELFGVYLALMIWGGLWLRDPRLRAMLPLRK